MRGIFLDKGLEYRLETKEDEWSQGDAVSVTLSVKNHTDQPLSLNYPYIHLASANLKKVHKKEQDAFKAQESINFEEKLELKGGETLSFNHCFNLKPDCPISDKAQSLYLLCGPEELENSIGQLPILVKPHPHIVSFVSLIESSFSFLLKAYKTKKGYVEAKLKAPSGKLFTTLEHIMLLITFDNKELKCKFCFHQKKLHASESTVNMKKVKKEEERTLPVGKYLLSGDVVDYDAFEKLIKEVLQTVEPDLQ